MNLTGVIIGVLAFVIIGVFHPIVIKSEYYFSKKIWPVFLVAGIGIIMGSLWAKAVLPAAILGVLGCSCLWSIQELFEQEKRVEKGWFPANPKRSKGIKEKSER